MKRRDWVILVAVVALALALGAAALWLENRPAGKIANVYQDGVCVRSIDLSQVREPYEFTLEDGQGHVNRVRVEPGRICVAEANCPDQVCVRTGWLSDGAKPIVCLPARLTIRLEKTARGPEAIDGVAG